MTFNPDDDPSRERREHIIRFFKDHGMPLGEPEDDKSRRILIIAGKQQLIQQVRQLLPEGDNFRIETALSGFEAGIQAESSHPHVIIIDFDLGLAESIMIVQNLRKSTNYDTTLIIGLANELNQTSTNIIANGFSEIVLKPVGVDQFCSRIRAHFGTT